MSTQTALARPDSTLSLTSSSCSESYTASSSSGSTQWGPGTVMGRLLLGFGERVKDRIDNLIIKRRLVTIRSRFPHEEKVTFPNMREAYSDLLELSRPDLYRAQYRRQALVILLTQIGTRQTTYVIEGLQKWPAIELKLVICQLMACLPTTWLPDDYPCQQFHRDLTNVYLGSQVNKEQHELHPFLEFLNALSQRSKSACQAILEARLLDMFVYMFARDFSTIEITDETSTGFKFSMHTRSSIMEISRTMITTLSSHRSTYAIIRDHPFRALCPREYLPDTFPPLEWRWIRRQLAWNGYPESLWDDRLRMIAIVQSKPQEHKGSDTDDLYADIIHFCSRSNPCRGGVSALAVVEAISLMMRGGPHCDMLLSIMSKISYQSNADALENIIKFLVLLRQQTGHRTFTIDQSRPTRGFMAYAIEAAKHSESIRDALLDADIARLLLYAISDTTRHSIVLPDSFKLGDPSSMILFSALVRSMAKSAEKTRLKAIGLNSWRATLRHAVDLFLLCDDFIANEDYQECRAHLYTILEDTAAT